MITFKSFLTEARKPLLKLDEFQKLKSCTQFISTSKGWPAYRGAEDVARDFAVQRVRTDRHAKSMLSEDTKFFNLGCELLFGEESVRSRASFCISNEELASFYGKTYFAFYPNNAKIIYSTKIDDAIRVHAWFLSETIEAINKDFYNFIFSAEGRDKNRHTKLYEWLPNTLKEYTSIQELFPKDNVPKEWDKYLQQATKKVFTNYGYKLTTNFSDALKKPRELLVFNIPEVYLVSTMEALSYYATFRHPATSAINSQKSLTDKINETYKFLLLDIDKTNI